MAGAWNSILLLIASCSMPVATAFVPNPETYSNFDIPSVFVYPSDCEMPESVETVGSYGRKYHEGESVVMFAGATHYCESKGMRLVSFADSAAYHYVLRETGFGEK